MSVATAENTVDSRLGVLHARTHRAVLDLFALDTRLGRTREKLASLERKTAHLRREQSLLTLELAATRRTLSVSQRALGVDLRSLYKRGEVSTLGIVLGARSLDDALSELDTLSRAADESRQIIGATSATSARIARLRSSLAVRRKQLDAATAAVRSDEAALEAARAQRLAFISHLRLEAQQLADLQAMAQRIERRSNELQAAAPAETVSVNGRALTVSATGYSLAGRTATGMPAGWGVVAVDPALIPLGTRLTIPGYGEAVAADTGGGVRGGSIDLWFPTLAQARAWGRRTVTIALH